MSSSVPVPYEPRRYWLYPSEKWLADHWCMSSVYAEAAALRAARNELAPAVRAMDANAVLIFQSTHVQGSRDEPRKECSGAALVLEATYVQPERVAPIIELVRRHCDVSRIAW